MPKIKPVTRWMHHDPINGLLSITYQSPPPEYGTTAGLVRVVRVRISVVPKAKRKVKK